MGMIVFGTMSDAWDEDEDKAKMLSIPGMALPGLRDLKVQFVAVIEFDLFLGPIAHINEIQSGSTYIKKLKNYQTLSEVYAGVARVDIKIVNTPEDSIAIFRYEHVDRNKPDETDIVTLLLISCMPDSDMEPIRTIGERALKRAKGDPESIGQELSISLREFQTGAAIYERSQSDQKIKIMAENQIAKPLNLSFVKGFGLIDLESNIADFRHIPQYIEGRNLEPIEILNFLDRQYPSIQPNYITSLLFNSIPLVIVRVEEFDVFFIVILIEANLVQIQQMGDWLQLTSGLMNKEWRYATRDEVQTAFYLINLSFTMNSPPEFIQNYVRTAIKCDRIYPIMVNSEFDNLEKPTYVSPNMWKALDSANGKQSIYQLSLKHGVDIFDMIKFFEWCKYRHIVEYLGS